MSRKSCVSQSLEIMIVSFSGNYSKGFRILLKLKVSSLETVGHKKAKRSLFALCRV